MELKKINDEIFELGLYELEVFSFNMIQEQGLFLLNCLLQRFYEKNEFEVAIIISRLLNTEISHWEGKDLFEIYFYGMVLEKYPTSVEFLESILTFCLPPYNDDMKKYINIDFYKKELFKINPNSHLLSLV